MGFLEAWKTAKKNFEQATGKKKPSEKWLLAFRKSTGVESAAKGLDDVLKKAFDWKAVLKAESEYVKAMTSYGDLLEKAAKSEDRVYVAEVKKLGAALDQMAGNFTTAKTKARDEFVSQLEKKAIALQASIQKSFGECQADQRSAERHAADADMGLREVLSALGKGDPTGAKTAAAKVGQAAKALDELHRHVATTYRKAEELFRKQEPLRKEITFCDHEMFGRDDSAADRAMTDAKGLVVVGMKRSAEALAEYAAEGKKVLAEALKALKGGAEAEAVYLGGVQRLAQRVFEGTTRLKRTAEIIAGEVDQVNFARMNGDEAQEPKEKQRLYDAARSKIEPQRKACREIAKELSRAKTEIQRELESFPQSALGNPKLKGFLDDIAAGQGLLQEISQDIEEQVIRLEQLEGKLR